MGLALLEAGTRCGVFKINDGNIKCCSSINDVIVSWYYVGKEPWLCGAVQKVQWLRNSWPATNNCFSHMCTTAYQYILLHYRYRSVSANMEFFWPSDPPRLLSRGRIMEGKKFWLSEVTLKLSGQRWQQRRQLHHLVRAPQPPLPQQSPLWGWDQKLRSDITRFCPWPKDQTVTGAKMQWFAVSLLRWTSLGCCVHLPHTTTTVGHVVPLPCPPPPARRPTQSKPQPSSQGA